MKRTQLHRIYFIYQCLRDGTYPNCRTLAERLEVDERTIHRDITFLRDFYCAPVEYDNRRRGYYLQDPCFTLPGLRLSEGEAVALLLGLNALSACGHTGLEGPLNSLMNKLPLILPAEVSVDLDEIRQGISFVAEPPRGDIEKVAANFSAIRQAIDKSERLEINYYSPGRDELTVRRVDPYHLRHFHGAWYMAAYCHLRGEVRTFALDRIIHLAPVDEHFQRPTSFNPYEYFGNSWRLERGSGTHRVTVRFSPYQARWLRGRRWHPTQQTEEGADGSLTVSFTVSSLGEVKRWVMQYGAEAEVLEPTELREEIARETARMARVYNSSGDPDEVARRVRALGQATDHSAVG